MNRQRLLCYGLQLHDHQTVSYYNIEDDTIVNLVHTLHDDTTMNGRPFPPFDGFPVIFLHLVITYQK